MSSFSNNAIVAAARERFSRVPIRLLLTSAFMLVTFVPLLVGGGVGFQQLQEAQRRDASQRIEALAANQVSQMLGVLSVQLRAFDVVADDPLLDATVITANELRETIDTYGDELATMSVFAADGSLRAASDGSLLERLDRFEFPEIADGVHAGRVRVRDERPVHQVTSALVRNGELAGWLLVEFETADFRDFVGDYTALGATGETLVVQQQEDGTTQQLFGSRLSGGMQRWPATADAGMPAIEAGRLMDSSTFGAIDYRGVEVVAVTRSLADLEWGIVVKQDLSEALRASDEFRAALLVGLGIGLALVLLVGWWVGRRVTQPLIALRDIANAVAAGDFSRRAKVGLNDEIGELSRSFNVMTNELVAYAESEARRTIALEDSNQRLVETETRTQTILETAAEGIIETDRLGIITAVNAAAEQIFGSPAPKLIGESINELVLMPPNDVLGHAFVAAEGHGGSGVEVSVRRPDGSLVPTWLTVSRLSVDSDVAYTGLIRDISERVAFEAELEYQATHDALTGLPNRKVLASELDLALERSAENGSPLALLFLDLDRFKQVNDTLGHQAGDELLRQVVARSRNALRPSDLLSRFGGDEFVILAEGIRGEEDALLLGERVRAALDEPFLIEGQDVFTSVSVGIVVASGGALNAEELLGDADNAMYRAKETGRNRIEVFDAGMREEVAHSHDLDMALRKATGNDELRFAYQPVIDVDTGHVAFVEALARWDRPGHGPVAPDQFIEMAETSGLIATLGPKLLAMAVDQLRVWNTTHSDSPISMSVNVSSMQLTQLAFVDDLKVLLDESGIDPGSLILEMTETAVVRDLDIVRDNLERARALGVVIAVDDFGSGYSSLGYLQKLPIDVLKMDRMLVADVEHQEESSIVDRVVTMTKALGVTIVAEGVETAPQFEKLRQIGCEQIQGYVIARPLDPDELEELAWNGDHKANLLPEGVAVRKKQNASRASSASS